MTDAAHQTDTHECDGNMFYCTYLFLNVYAALCGLLNPVHTVDIEIISVAVVQRAATRQRFVKRPAHGDRARQLQARSAFFYISVRPIIYT